MIRDAIIVIGIIVIAMLAFAYKARSVGVFPPLAYLASELGVGRGAQLPKGVIYNGRPFFFYVINAQEHGNGRYTVELQAR